MKVWGLLCWYEEPESWLVSTVCSVRDLCNGIIAVDGPYASFPGALRVPRSDPAQAEAILHAAWSSNLIANIHIPTEAWWGGEIAEEEVAKRDFMFHLADSIADPGDWYLVIDADETIHFCPADARQRLERAEEDVAEVDVWHRPNEHYPSPRLYRGPGLSVQGQHYRYFKGDKLLGWPRIEAVPALDMTDIVMEHRIAHRSEHRKHQKEVYYALRDKMVAAMAGADGG